MIRYKNASVSIVFNTNFGLNMFFVSNFRRTNRLRTVFESKYRGRLQLMRLFETKLRMKQNERKRKANVNDIENLQWARKLIIYSKSQITSIEDALGIPECLVCIFFRHHFRWIRFQVEWDACIGYEWPQSAVLFSPCLVDTLCIFFSSISIASLSLFLFLGRSHFVWRHNTINGRYTYATAFLSKATNHKSE